MYAIAGGDVDGCNAWVQRTIIAAMRLDRILSNQAQYSRQTSRQLIASGRVTVNDVVCRTPDQEVDRFAAVSLDGTLIKPGRPAHYLMLYKPAGYLSATCDPQHPTVMALLPDVWRDELHIGGRLDRSTTGLLILTNDGLWSRRLTEPRTKLAKVYHVRTRQPISSQTASRFAEGIHFAYEGLTTSPAQLEQLDEYSARLTIYEGRYHQVKRMFHAVGNQVESLHRESMGSIVLDPLLTPGQYRPLSPEEIASLGC